jgi:hypothetical protein
VVAVNSKVVGLAPEKKKKNFRWHLIGADLPLEVDVAHARATKGGAHDPGLAVGVVQVVQAALVLKSMLKILTSLTQNAACSRLKKGSQHWYSRRNTNFV